MIPTALTIAGSDPSGGAGIQADLKTFHQRKVYGMAVLTLLTAQNTQSVKEVHVLAAGTVLRQLEAVLKDIKPRAVKTGALGSVAIIRGISKKLWNFSFPLVVDPVMVSKHGTVLLKKNAIEALRKELLPRASLVTPNIAEAEVLSGVRIRDLRDMKKAAIRILSLGPGAVLVKGGHLKGHAADLFYDGKKTMVLNSPRIMTRHTHGTGCTYSAAITAELAKGKKLPAAVRTAKKFITRAIRTAPGLGHGSGPVNHFAKV